MPDLSTNSTLTKVTLADCCEEIALRVENPSESGYERFVGLEHLESGETSIRHWGRTEDVTSSMKLFKAGDVIVARRNVYLRRAARADFDGVCSGDGIVLRASGKACLPDLLPFLLNTEAFWDYVSSQADGTMSKRITVKRLMAYEFALPPLEEQRRIAEVLRTAATVLDSLAAVADAAERALASAAAHEFDALLRDSVPTVRLATLCSRKPQSGLYKSEEFRGQGTPMVNMGELFGHDIIDDTVEMERIIADDSELERYSLTPNDLLFGRRSVVLEGAGRCVLVGAISSPIVFESSVLRATVDPERADSRYVFEWLRSPYGHQQIRRIVTFTTVSGVAGSDVARLPIPAPPISIQTDMAERLSRLRRYIELPWRRHADCAIILSSVVNKILGAA